MLYYIYIYIYIYIQVIENNIKSVRHILEEAKRVRKTL
jgi:hypothetical protein